MPVAKPKPATHSTAADTTKAVDDFMATLEHPFKDEIEAIRRAILSVDPGIFEGIKWNAPSFRTSDYFATTILREKGWCRSYPPFRRQGEGDASRRRHCP